jgi:hypothetical protein
MRSSYSTTENWLIAGNNFTNDVNPSDAGEIPKTTINLRAGDHIYIYDNTLNDDAVSIGPDDVFPVSATVSWIKLDGNTINNAQVELHGAVRNMMVSNNVISEEGYPHISLLPTDAEGRVMGNIFIENNTGVMQGATGSFIVINGDSNGNTPGGIFTIENNVFAAPNVNLTNNYQVSINVMANSANSIVASAHNVWAAPSIFWQTAGAVAHIFPNEFATNNFYTLAQWNSMPFVNSDFSQVTTLGANTSLSIGGQVEGAVLPGALT